MRSGTGCCLASCSPSSPLCPSLQGKGSREKIFKPGCSLPSLRSELQLEAGHWVLRHLGASFTWQTAGRNLAPSSPNCRGASGRSREHSETSCWLFVVVSCSTCSLSAWFWGWEGAKGPGCPDGAQGRFGEKAATPDTHPACCAQLAAPHCLANLGPRLRGGLDVQITRTSTVFPPPFIFSHPLGPGAVGMPAQPHPKGCRGPTAP